MKKKTPPTPSRQQLLLAALLLFIGIFAALKAAFEYWATGVVPLLSILMALAGLAFGGGILRNVKDNAKP